MWEIHSNGLYTLTLSGRQNFSDSSYPQFLCLFVSFNFVMQWKCSDRGFYCVWKKSTQMGLVCMRTMVNIIYICVSSDLPIPWCNVRFRKHLQPESEPFPYHSNLFCLLIFLFYFIYFLRGLCKTKWNEKDNSRSNKIQVFFFSSFVFVQMFEHRMHFTNVSVCLLFLLLFICLYTQNFVFLFFFYWFRFDSIHFYSDGDGDREKMKETPYHFDMMCVWSDFWSVCLSVFDCAMRHVPVGLFHFHGHFKIERQTTSPELKM